MNDLAMVGAEPRHLTAGFILPEGFLLEDLGAIAESMRRRAEEVGVRVVARTPLGGRRRVDPPTGELLPRTC